MDKVRDIQRMAATLLADSTPTGRRFEKKIGLQCEVRFINQPVKHMKIEMFDVKVSGIANNILGGKIFWKYCFTEFSRLFQRK